VLNHLRDTTLGSAYATTSAIAIGVQGGSASTGAGIGVYGTMTASANTGYAGYFWNPATSGANYGVYGVAASGSGYGGYLTDSGSGWALDATVTSYFNGSVGIGASSDSTIGRV